jgi:EAL domain-containing protein (putative c-di-GMP-specific phosphodiesterase class I)
MKLHPLSLNYIQKKHKELNITTVAEFVHSKEVFKVVKQLQVDEIQGFYLSKPLKEIKA